MRSYLTGEASKPCECIRPSLGKKNRSENREERCYERCMPPPQTALASFKALFMALLQLDGSIRPFV